VPTATSLVLGRDPGESLVAAAFADFENVSRRHATVTVSDTGEATIRDEHSTNGTFVNGDRVLPGSDVLLTDGDSVRLGADVAADVSLPGQGPAGGAFSTNGHRGPG
jgi:pSer/pThr/pTyr-binding forkhead associated (FHA) protein